MEHIVLLRRSLENANVRQCCRSSDNKVHGANMGPIWGRQDPGGPHVGPMNFAIWIIIGSGNVLPPVRHQTITCTYADLLLSGFPATYISEI